MCTIFATLMQNKNCFNKAAEEKDELVTVAGKNCESGDILIKDIKSD